MRRQHGCPREDRLQTHVRAHFGGAVDADGEVLGVVPLLDGLDHRPLQVHAERRQLLVAVQLRPEACRRAPAVSWVHRS